MADREESFTGGCFCGRVRYAVTAVPKWIAYCHCESCRRQTASPVAPFICVERQRLDFTEQLPETYESSAGVTRSFCGRCGTPIAYETERRPGEIDLHLGSLDDPSRFPPSFHVFFGERLAWFDTNDDLPRHERGS